MERLILERKGRVLVATNNHPATRNSLSWDFYDGFREAVEAASADPGIGAIVVTGAGGFFLLGRQCQRAEGALGGGLPDPALERG